ncbi:MAG: lysoplasmalogenase [Christensenellaceae bacterium]|jgi:hypothetical protein|nr:lysoplasmalogenase [Christensenellaceae bacterium]
MDTLTLVLSSASSLVTALLVAFFLVIRITKKPVYGLVAKILPSLGFVLMGVLAIVTRSLDLPFGAAFIIMGLVFGLVGDIVLDLKRAHSEFENLYLKTGMISFIVGHFFFLAAFVLVGINHQIDLLLPMLVPVAIALILAPITVIVSKKVIKANFGKFKILSASYAGLLIYVTISTLWLAILDVAFLIPAIGMILFLFSDLVLSQMYFVDGKAENKALVIINHSTYYAAQILLAVSLFLF